MAQNLVLFFLSNQSKERIILKLFYEAKINCDFACSPLSGEFRSGSGFVSLAWKRSRKERALVTEFGLISGHG